MSSQETPENENEEARISRPIGLDNVARLIEDAYASITSPFQYVRELVTNSIRAAAERIAVTFDPEIFAQTGVRKAVFVDSGSGMTPGALRRHFGNLSSSGDLVTAGDPKGVGTKYAVYPWNQLGTVIETFPLGDTHGYRLTIIKDRKGQYGPKVEFDEVTGEYGDVETISRDGLRKYLGREAKSGTVVTLLGSAQADETFFGPTGRVADATTRGVIKYLNQKFWNLEGVALKADDGRFARGLQHYLQRGSRVEEVVDLPGGFRVHAYHLKSAKDNEGFHDTCRVALVALLHENETYALVEAPSSGAGAASGAWRDFGLSWGKACRETAIVVEVPKAALLPEGGYGPGVYPDPARDRLKYNASGGGKAMDVPLKEIGAAFAEAMPKYFRDLRNQRLEEVGESVAAGAQQQYLEDTMAALKDHQVGRRNPQGKKLGLLSITGGVTGTKEQFKPTPKKKFKGGERGSHGGGTGGRNFCDVQTEGEHRCSPVKFKAERLMPAMQRSSDAEALAANQGFPFEFLEAENALRFYVIHPVIKRVCERLEMECPDVSAETIRELVYTEASRKALAVVIEARKMKSSSMTTAAAAQLLTSAAISAPTLGFFNVETLTTAMRRAIPKLKTRVVKGPGDQPEA